MRETQILSLFIQFRDHLKNSNRYLTLCTDSYVASNRGLWSLLYRLFNANVCKCIFSKYGTSIEVVTESKLHLLTTQWANKSGDEILGQGIKTLFGNLAD